eukprot:UN13506
MLNKTTKSMAIGIMSYDDKMFELSNINWCFDDKLSYVSHQLFSMCEGGGGLLNEANGYYKHEMGKQTVFKKITTSINYCQQDDIISLKANFKTYKIEFWINDQLVNEKEYDISPGITYYPALSSWDYVRVGSDYVRTNVEGAKYEILACS